jgi:hypothetical protein
MDNEMLAVALRLIADSLRSTYCRDILNEAADRLEEKGGDTNE